MPNLSIFFLNFRNKKLAPFTMNIYRIAFILSSVKGILSPLKRISIFYYLQKYAMSNGFVFLQETNYWKYIKKWEDQFKGKLLLACRKTNFCGVLFFMEQG